ncbi:prolipoprotein diacylglyceryl transferase [Mycobacterium sp. 852002-50816_SCH5313054-b]|uniref:prolipoprotein diacylglyceryl transferase n=1 Tax=Mycobacterium sp. 852002-50816_SCH5313054-b TaxID=1834092 RepID=UPI0007FFC2F5|nr:prolipoprotein diacylglyceryl transferase [Mycobacterium sp. 852002-50816_SCH5313054-b]OBF63260.1 prolipoprotein diacylglyceryl transferase [Mycobacterium sp. 852002-50816_SCH5313054-b]
MTHLLAYFPSPARGVWHLGPLPIRAYALFIITGIVVALMIGDRRWEARGGQRGVIYDIALWAVPFGLLGGRLYHLATDWRTYWGPGGAGFGAALRIWDGGLGIWGAVALGGVGAWIACRRRGIPVPAFGDAIAPGIILAQAIGRLGNYFNQELYGRETTVPWGLQIFYRRDPSGYVDPHSLDGVSTGQVAFVVHPTFLYELIWNVVLFAVLIYVDRRFNFGHGRLFALYVAGYCVGRFGVELMRNDTATLIAGIRINVFTSTFVFIGAVVYIILAPKGREDPASLHTDYPVPDDAPAPKPQTEPEPEPITGASVVAAAAVAGALAAGKRAKRLIPGRRSKPVQPVEAEAEAETVKAEAEVPETVTAEPETVAAMSAEPVAAQAETEDAEAAEAETDVAQGAEPESEEQEAEAEETEAEEPEAKDAEAAEAETEVAQGAEPESEEQEAEAEETEAEEPQAEETETEEPEADEAEAAEPEVAAAEAAVAEAEESEPAEPEAAESAAAAEAEAVATEAEEAEVAEPEAEDLEAEPEPAEPKDEEPEADSEPERDAEAGKPPQRRLSFRLRNRRDR